MDDEQLLSSVELSTEDSSSLSPNSTSTNPPASLSLSEDSDTARIYDLNTMETRFEKRPQTVVGVQKVVSPDTVKFFAPKNKFSMPVEVESAKTMEPTPPHHLPSDNANVDLINRLVIEDDVLPMLPSVKKLASTFASIQAKADEEIQRPKVER